MVIMVAGKIVVTGSPESLKKRFGKDTIEQLFIELVQRGVKSGSTKDYL